MTHAWLITGPPGSGRSNAGLAFAAALQCEQGGCGFCHACETSLAGSHSDVAVYRPRGAQTYLIDDMREMVLEAARMPSQGRWRVLIVEEADRFGVHGSNYRSAGALLKAIEEPTPRTVWVLSAPTAADTTADDRQPVPTGRPRRPVGPGRGRAARPGRRRRPGDGRLRGGREPGARRASPRPRPRRGLAAAPRRGRGPPAADRDRRRLPDRGGQPRRRRQGRRRGRSTAPREESELRLLAAGLRHRPGGRRPPGAAGALKELEDGRRSGGAPAPCATPSTGPSSTSSPSIATSSSSRRGRRGARQRRPAPRPRGRGSGDDPGARRFGGSTR